MKISTVLSLLGFCSLISAQFTCDKYQCVGNGGACGADSVCSGYNYACISGTCQPLAAAGISCSLDSDCQTTLQGGCVNGVCNKGYLPGAVCSNNYDCVYSSSATNFVTSCVSGRCAGISAGESCTYGANFPMCNPPALCNVGGSCVAPQSLGAACGDSSECQIAYVCLNNTCSNPIADGSACIIQPKGGEDGCRLLSQCTPTSQSDSQNGKCVRSYSQGSGSLCSDNSYCGDNLFCQSPASGNLWGVCTSATSSFRACDYTSTNSSGVCNAGEACVCNNNNGNGICEQPDPNASGTSNDYQNTGSCALKCNQSDYSCVSNNCGNQICDFSNSFSSPGPNGKESVFSCGSDYTSLIGNSLYPGYLFCGAGSLVQYTTILLAVSILACFI